SAQGVRKGQKFGILAGGPIEIHAPVTGEALGNIQREKTGVQVARVENRFAVCMTYRANPFSTYTHFPPPEPASEGEESALMDDEVPYVKVRDDVILVDD